MKELFVLLGGALLTALLFLLGLVVALFGGYLFGMIIAIIPYVSDWLTFNGALPKSQFPSITAWLAVAGLFLRSGAVQGEKGERGIQGMPGPKGDRGGV